MKQDLWGYGNAFFTSFLLCKTHNLFQKAEDVGSDTSPKKGTSYSVSDSQKMDLMQIH